MQCCHGSFNGSDFSDQFIVSKIFEALFVYVDKKHLSLSQWLLWSRCGEDAWLRDSPHIWNCAEDRNARHRCENRDLPTRKELKGWRPLTDVICLWLFMYVAWYASCYIVIIVESPWWLLMAWRPSCNNHDDLRRFVNIMSTPTQCHHPTVISRDFTKSVTNRHNGK